MASRRPVLVALILLAFGLRLYQLGRSPLRGDEAFTVRYWAAPPAAILDPVNGLAWREPHPFAAFFGFWAWESLLGESEIAMRLLPVVINLLGVPALYGVGRRLSGKIAVGLSAAALWALNPYLIWHSQDVRNYAIWAGLSVLALWLLMVATSGHRRSRWRWIAYIVVVTLALYTFFLEAFMLAVHGLFVLMFRRERFKMWIAAMVVIAILLIPWIGQIAALAGSGYRGTAGILSADKLANAPWYFYWVLGIGDILPSGDYSALPIAAAALFGVSLAHVIYCERRQGLFIALLMLVPYLLLVVVSTQLAIFLPRYILSITPAIALTWTYLFKTARRAALPAILTAYVLPCVLSLIYYYGPEYHKAPNWYGLRDYLIENTTADDAVIVASVDPATGYTDPSFAYYYSGPARVTALPHPDLDVDTTVRDVLEKRRAVWFVVTGEATQAVNDALLKYGALISDEGAYNSFPVRQYRAKTPRPGEIEHPLALQLGGGTLVGYSLSGLPRAETSFTVLLFWDRLPAPHLTTFVHLMGKPKADGSTLWTQRDHPPGGERDVYRLNLADVEPETYALEIGLYDPATNVRVPITDSGDNVLGNSYIVARITVLPQNSAVVR